MKHQNQKKNICSIVFDKYQFCWTNGSINAPKEKDSWKHSQELAYKLYNHYQDSNNINGYTILELKDINVVLSLGDSANVSNFCSKEGKNGYYLLNAVSYLDRSKNEINCYFNIK